MKPLIFQPYKKGVISGEILSIIACTGIFAYIMFDSGGTPSRRLLIFMGILIAAFALIFIVEGQLSLNQRDTALRLKLIDMVLR